MKNMVKKNQVMITALALMIAVAGYLNFAGNRITQEEIVTTGSDTVETAKVTGDDSQYEDIQSMDSELVLEEDNYLEQSMDDILAEDITVDEENADLEAGSDSVEEITGDVPGEAVFTSVAGMDSLSGAKLLKEQTRAKSRETFLEIINNTNIAEEQKQEAIDGMIELTDVAEKETAAEILLEAKGFEKPSEFWKAVEEEEPSLVILDVMLPEESGIDVLKKIRSNPAIEKLPVIMETAKTSEYDRINGLESGADDYISKPFSMMEMVARVKALIRRSEYKHEEKDYTINNLYVCPIKHLVKVDDREVVLTLKEYEMLCLLLKNRGIVLSREQLLNKIWGYSFDGESRTVDVHVRTLRQKLGTAGDVIKTIRGVGYKISA